MLFLATVFSLYSYESHLETCPLTGRKKFVALKQGQVEKISKLEFEQVLFEFPYKL